MGPFWPQITFYGLDPRQIDRDWVAAGFGLEAYIFHGDDLHRPDFWAAFRASLEQARRLGATRLTLHFPTDGAEHLRDDSAAEALLGFCRLASEVGAVGVTVHSNLFLDLETYQHIDLPAWRHQFVEQLQRLDLALGELGVWLGVENLPIVGNDGTDVDPLFVLPEDFGDLERAGLTHVGVTWDVCHWAQTYALTAARATLDRTPEPSFQQFPGAIRHIHFASFRGLALPGSSNRCTEGILPAEGDINPDLLAEHLERVARQTGPVGLVFEVQEEDYTRRRACWKALAWLRSHVGEGAATREP